MQESTVHLAGDYQKKVGGCGLSKGHIWPYESFFDMSVLVHQRSFSEITH